MACTHVTANQDPADSPEIERAMREFFSRWGDQVDELADELEAALRRGAIDLDTLEAISADIEMEMGEFTNDIEVVFREHSEMAAEAGRAVAGRQYALDIAFDIVPRRTIEELDDWAVTASQHVSDSVEDEMTRYLRGAHREGLSVDEIADDFQEEFIEGRVKDSKAEQLARDNTVAPSNAGSHTAFRDANSVVGEEWLATSDGRTRDSHLAAGGQIVEVNQPFLVGGYRADHPGDPSLPVEEYTRCRCTIVPVFADQLTDSQLRRLAAGQRI